MYTIVKVIAFVSLFLVGSYSIVCLINVAAKKTKFNIWYLIGFICLISILAWFRMDEVKQDRENNTIEIVYETPSQTDIDTYNIGYEEGYTKGKADEHLDAMSEYNTIYEEAYKHGFNDAIYQAQVIEVTEDGYTIMFGNESQVHEYDWDW